MSCYCQDGLEDLKGPLLDPYLGPNMELQSRRTRPGMLLWLRLELNKSWVHMDVALLLGSPAGAPKAFGKPILLLQDGLDLTGPLLDPYSVPNMAF